MPAHVLYGDSFLVRQTLKSLEAEAGLEDLMEANRHHLDGPQVYPAELLGLCNVLPFMDSGRMVVAQGVLTAHDGRTGRRRGRRAQSDPALGQSTGWE